MPELQIRAAAKGDEDVIFTLLHELADYEKLLDKFNITREIIVRDYLSDPAMLNCHLAFENEKPVGVMTWYWTYTSFAAARGVYLEDLYVRPQTRGKGYGKALLAHLAKEAVKAGASRIEWSVLTWNKPSIDFYESLGARQPDDWFIYRINDDALTTLAAMAS
jgi:GNAT superfamily N-acetyltransferase